MGVTVSINGADQRTDQALAKVTRDNQIVTLTASRDLRFLTARSAGKTDDRPWIHGWSEWPS